MDHEATHFLAWPSNVYSALEPGWPWVHGSHLPDSSGISCSQPAPPNWKGPQLPWQRKRVLRKPAPSPTCPANASSSQNTSLSFPYCWALDGNVELSSLMSITVSAIASLLASLCLNFLIYKMVLIRPRAILEDSQYTERIDSASVRVLAGHTWHTH